MCAVGPGRRTYIELMGELPAGNLRQHHSIVEGAAHECKSISAGSYGNESGEAQLLLWVIRVDF